MAEILHLQALIPTALRQAGHWLPPKAIEAFVKDIETSVSAYSAYSEREQSARKGHKALRKVWGLLDDPDPPVGLIRTQMKSLPRPAKAWLLQRGNALWEQLIGGDFYEAIFDKWVLSANQLELVRVLKSLISEGGMMLDGRQDRQPKKGFEPMIMGVIRGTGEGLSQGGRPSLTARDELVMHLAIDWLHATGERPQQGRSDKEGFASIVYMIFDLIEIKSTRKSNGADENNGAEQALRRYWAAVANNGYAPIRKKPLICVGCI